MRNKKSLRKKIAAREEKARIVAHNLALYGYGLDNPPPRGCEVHMKHWFLFLRNHEKRKRRVAQ